MQSESQPPHSEKMPSAPRHAELLLETPSLLQRLHRLLLRATVDQWDAIDREYLQSSPRTSLRTIGVFLLTALILTLQRYYGNRKFFVDTVGDWVSSLPFPGLWGHIYWAMFTSVCYVLFPALFAWWVFGDRLSDYGVKLKGAGRYLGLYLAMFLVVFPFVVVASGSPAFLARYPFYPETGRSWTQLLLWEGAYGVQFLALEYFFRGFMLFSLARVMGAHAIFAMVVPYTMIHFPKPFAETMGAIIAGTALGTLALRTRSIIGGILIHVAVAWSMDGLALWRKGALQKLLGLD